LKSKKDPKSTGGRRNTKRIAVLKGEGNPLGKFPGWRKGGKYLNQVVEGFGGIFEKKGVRIQVGGTGITLSVGDARERSLVR